MRQKGVFQRQRDGCESEVLNPDGKTLQFRCLAALAAKFIDNICIKQTVFRQK